MGFFEFQCWALFSNLAAKSTSNEVIITSCFKSMAFSMYMMLINLNIWNIPSEFTLLTYTRKPGLFLMRRSEWYYQLLHKTSCWCKFYFSLFCNLFLFLELTFDHFLHKYLLNILRWLWKNKLELGFKRLI